MATVTQNQPLGLELVPPSSSILRQVSKPLNTQDIGSRTNQELFDAMLKLAYGEQGDADRPTLVGLAAPQVGVGLRVIIVGIDADGKGNLPTLKLYINPKIVKASEAVTTDREGCYSTGRVCGIVERAESVIIEALDRDGKLVSEEHFGFPARIFQHEIDHLDGIRFPDKIIDDQNLLWVDPEDFGEFRKSWQAWPNKCPRSKWQAIKAGR